MDLVAHGFGLFSLALIEAQKDFGQIRRPRIESYDKAYQKLHMGAKTSFAVAYSLKP